MSNNLCKFRSIFVFWVQIYSIGLTPGRKWRGCSYWRMLLASVGGRQKVFILTPLAVVVVVINDQRKSNILKIIIIKCCSNEAKVTLEVTTHKMNLENKYSIFGAKTRVGRDYYLCWKFMYRGCSHNPHPHPHPSQ